MLHHRLYAACSLVYFSTCPAALHRCPRRFGDLPTRAVSDADCQSFLCPAAVRQSVVRALQYRAGRAEWSSMAVGVID